MKQRMLNVGATAVVVLALLVGVFAMVSQASASGTYPPAHTVQSYARYTLLTSNGITQAVNGTGVRVAGYDYADCFGVFDVTASQTATLALQASADGTNYVALATFTAQTTDTVVATRTAVLGEYFRAAVTTLGSANPVTVSVKCVMKN